VFFINLVIFGHIGIQFWKSKHPDVCKPILQCHVNIFRLQNPTSIFVLCWSSFSESWWPICVFYQFGHMLATPIYLQ